MSVATVIRPKARDLGDFVVRRSLPALHRQMVGPFIFFDHMGPADFPPGAGIDVRPHPHINLATVTYLFDGELFHRDSTGAAQNIEPGAVNWMTAGSGIVHSERSSPLSRARHMHIEGIQSWVALPVTHEQVPPSFVHYPAATLPQWQQGQWECRLIAGRAFGKTSPVETLSPLFYVDCHAQRADTLDIDCPYTERAVYVARGEICIDGSTYSTGDFLVLEPDTKVRIEAHSTSRVMLLGGEAFAERRYIWWNFVSSSQRRLEDAKQRWRDGHFPPVAGEHEFIPLPDPPARKTP
ncbi:MAG: pirin family protein [Pseudomonadota bacterium]